MTSIWLGLDHLYVMGTGGSCGIWSMTMDRAAGTVVPGGSCRTRAAGMNSCAVVWGKVYSTVGAAAAACRCRTRLLRGEGLYAAASLHTGDEVQALGMQSATIEKHLATQPTNLTKAHLRCALRVERSIGCRVQASCWGC